VYDPEMGFQLGGQYKKAIAEAKEITKDDPENYNKVLVAKLIPIVGPDGAFATLTRSIRSGERTRTRNATIESSRIFSDISGKSFDALKSNLEKKYGPGWIGKMDDIDRLTYENARQTDALIQSGELPPLLQEIQKTIEFRVNPAEMARLSDEENPVRGEIASSEKTWRDADGRLVSGEDRVSIDDKGRVVVDGAKAEDVVVKDFEDVPDRPVDMAKALADLETVMASHKGTEVIKTDADIGTGIIPEMMRVGQKESIKLLEPDLKSKDAQPWINKQVTYIARLMEMGEIKTKADYKEVLDTYTQRGDVDPDLIYNEAKKARKFVAEQIKAAEKKSAKANVTQKQFKPEKQMVSIDSMEIIKDRIRSINEGVKLGKKLTKAQYKEQKVMRQDVINEAEKIVNDMTDDAAIRNRFKLRAQKAIKTNKSLATFVEQLTAFVEKDVDIKTRKELVNKLNKDISGSVHAEYAEAIIDLRDMINTDTSAKSKWRLKSQEDALSRHPDIELPSSVIKKLSQTSIDEVSTKDLGLIVAEVERLTQLGKTKYGIENKRFKDDVASIVSDISRTSKQAPVSKFETDHKDRRRFKSLKLWLGRGSLRPWNTMDLLDGGKATYDGTAHRVFVDDANVAFNRYMDINDQRIFGGESIIRANDMKVSDLSKSIKFNGHKFTIDQILSIYASSKNKLMHNAVLHGNMKGDKKTYNEIVNHVANDSKLKSLADYIVYDYANNYDRVRKAVIRNENKILGQEENYIPMIRTDVDKPIELSEIANDLFGRSDMAKELPDNSFTIDRAKVPDDLQIPIKLGLFDQWEKSVSTQERYINLFEQVKKMEAVLSDKDLSKQIKDAYGSDMKEIIDGYVTAYGNPMSIYGSGSVGHASRKLRKNIALGYLSFNMMTMLKQVPSIALYMGQGGGRNMLVSLDDFNKSWSMEGGKPVNDLVKFVEGKDPQIKHAHIERELAVLKKTDLNGYERVMSSIGETGMKGIIGFDKAVRTVGWYSTYLKALESGKSDAEAVRLARNATLRTQPAASAKDLAHIYKEVSPWFTMFSNQINQIYNLMSYQLPRSALAGDIGAAAGIMSGLVINAVVFHTLMHGKMPETEEDFARMIKEQSLGKLPLVGGPISGAMSGYDAENPAVGLVTDATMSLNKALESGDKKAQEEAVKVILQSAGAASGFPVTGVRRALDFAEEGNLKNLFGIREN